jgi:hypothetical protein
MKFNARLRILSLIFFFVAAAFLSGCGPSTSSATALISTAGGTPQSATVSTAFPQPLQAAVTTNDGNATPLTGLAVTFTVVTTTTGGGTFLVNGAPAATDTETTDSNGVATSQVFTASVTPGGPYTVTATVAGEAAPATFSLTNSPWSYSFYLSGLEVQNQQGNGPNFYALAGAVQVDGNGNVLAGEQDYNDAAGLLSPQPGGDTISAGALTVDPTTGQGTLSLLTSNAALGGGTGTETLGVQFVNVNHALIVQFDGSATSSGSLDLQTSQSTQLPSGMGYSFTLSGVDPTYYPVVYGGVFSIGALSTNNAPLQGFYDENDAGYVTLKTAFSGTISAPDNFGRGTITGTNLGGRTYTALNYYVVAPEAIRIVDVDAGADNNGDSAVGSAFGQGINPNTNLPNTFNSAALGSSVFGIEATPWLGYSYAAAGQFATTPGGGSGASVGALAGMADDDEEGSVIDAVSISGNYSVALNGYGSLSILGGDLGDVSALGIYLTDPSLNLLDPNNTASGLGGGLVADLDTSLIGAGVLLPQTDVAASDFTGNYAFGAQDYNDLNPASGGVWGDAGWEFDFVGQGSITNLAFGGAIGLVSDPFGDLATPGSEYTAVGFSGTGTETTPGRYTIPLTVAVPDVSSVALNVVIYQASAGQLFWVDEDSLDLFLGSLQQQGSLAGLPQAPAQPSIERAAAKSRLRQAK